MKFDFNAQVTRNRSDCYDNSCMDRATIFRCLSIVCLFPINPASVKYSCYTQHRGAEDRINVRIKLKLKQLLDSGTARPGALIVEESTESSRAMPTLLEGEFKEEDETTEGTRVGHVVQ
jgi:hypothetical protein